MFSFVPVQVAFHSDTEPGYQSLRILDSQEELLLCELHISPSSSTELAKSLSNDYFKFP